MSTRPLEEHAPDEEILTQEPAKVILFNDDEHTFEEVISQLVKALRCGTNRAEALAWEAHTNGRAMVFAGELARCVEVSSILEEIALLTQIEVA